ncbi:signal peptide peptidase SppA [Bacillus massiliigorillae]|uniref:signal peptide peptidase SppA n=1 Tax=Bacillus massiliigorillae TaxID=1243664 RepID=UPI00039A9352|nr:signal peptide peptidase SppA [Bacillus massiliigorillae]
MNGKRWAALGIAAGLFVFSIFTSLASWAIFSSDDDFNSLDEFFSMAGGEFAEEVIEEGNPLNKIAVLDVDGVISDSSDASSLFGTVGYNHRSFMNKLEMVKEDDSVAGVVIRVNSPGGGVVESAEIYDKIQELKNETKKPVYVSMGATAASGGYYISAPADKIYANPETLTGSLGVIMQGYNYEKLAEKVGIETVTIKSGPYKDIMSGNREMTAEERKILQNMIDSSYSEFVRIIAEGRGMTEAQVRKIADGRIYNGRQAKEIGLVDEFGYLEDVTDAMKKAIKNEDASVVRYTDNIGFGSLFSMTTQKLLGEKLDLSSIMKVVSQPNSPRLMYLYAE